MRGDWVAWLDWGNSAGGIRLELSEDRESDAVRVSDGRLSAILAGVLDESGDRIHQATHLLESYRRQGEACFSRLRGRFAVLICDEAERRLVALRDPMGIYPLFFSRTSCKVAVAPSLVRLREVGACGAVSRVALARHLWHRWPEKDRTYFDAVRRVPAGHALQATEKEDSLVRYWDPTPGKPDGGGWLESAELAQFEEFFSRSVERFGRAEKPGIFLSGGLDSVSIASCLSETRSERERPIALCLAFDHPECDESAIQAEVASALGLEQEVQVVAARADDLGPLERAAELTSGWPVPLMNVWNGEFFRLAQSGRDRGCDVILTGSGGDDWLGVSPYYAADLLRAGRLVTLARLTGALRKSFGMTAFEAARLVVWRFGLRALLRRTISTALGRFAPGVQRRVWRRRVQRSMPSWLAPGAGLRRELSERSRPPIPSPGSSFYVREMRKGLDHPLIALELEESFEIGRRLDIELAHPFFDPDLVDFLYRAPPRLLVGEGGPDRQLVRAMLATKFPGLGFARLRKSDARPFFAKLALNEGARLWRELGGARELGNLGIVDARGVEADVGSMLSNPGSKSLFRLWDLINLECWLRGQTGPDREAN